jgi:hypothetical protein
MTAAEILQKHEDANEMHLHHVDRKWVIQAMEEYAKEKSEKPINLIGKQTAVEWLIIQIKNDQNQKVLTGLEWMRIFEQAKAMEKEQMEGAVYNGISKADMVDNRGYFNFDKWYNETYEANNYDAWDEVIDQLGDTNEMIDHIGEVNEMVDHVPDVGKMVSDTYTGENPFNFVCQDPDCPHCIEEINQMRDDYLEDDLVKLVISEWNEYEERTGNPPYMYHLGFTEGYNKAKETLFTEEQLKTAIHKAIIFSEENRKITLGEYAVKFPNFYEELIQSLKQPKQ